MDKRQTSSGSRSANPQGWSKGMAIVEYSTPEEAGTAVATLHGSIFGTRTLVVEPWTDHGKPPPQVENPGESKGKYGGKSSGKDSGKDSGKGKGKGDSTSNSWGITLPWEKNRSTKAGKGGGKAGESKNPACKVYVGQLAYSTTWQDLTEHFSQVGTVVYSKIIMDTAKGKSKSANPDGWSKGMGIVEFSSPQEAQLAMMKLGGTTLHGRQIVVDEWKND